MIKAHKMWSFHTCLYGAQDYPIFLFSYGAGLCSKFAKEREALRALKMLPWVTWLLLPLEFFIFV